MKLFSSKGLIKAAHIYCLLFSPFYAPLWAFIWLFLYSYLRLLPLAYKIFILLILLLFRFSSFICIDSFFVGMNL